MALAGKDLGKDVGQWFGPSTAAGAIKCALQFLFLFVLLTQLIVLNFVGLWYMLFQKQV